MMRNAWLKKNNAETTAPNKQYINFFCDAAEEWWRKVAKSVTLLPSTATIYFFIIL